jgi:hypothetical protein
VFFEDPQPHRGHEYIVDYAALYAAAVWDYLKMSHDWATAQELWPVVRQQMAFLTGYVGGDGLFRAPSEHGSSSTGAIGWTAPPLCTAYSFTACGRRWRWPANAETTVGAFFRNWRPPAGILRCGAADLREWAEAADLLGHAGVDGSSRHLDKGRRGPGFPRHP